jgi:hypothetical protein
MRLTVTDCRDGSAATSRLPCHSVSDIGDLHLRSSEWVDRRFDRLEFVGLTTIARSITLTLDIACLGRLIDGPRAAIPLGLFVRGGPPSQVRDASGRIVRHLPSVQANMRFREALSRRLAAAGLTDFDGELDEIAVHRSDACARLGTDGYAELAAERWGCPAVAALLAAVRDLGPDDAAQREIVRLLFDWQNSEPLVIEAPDELGLIGTITVAFDEELGQWQPPWDRRCPSVPPGDPLLDDRDYARRVSRGGPFDDDLNALSPSRPRSWLFARPSARLRTIGRRMSLRQSWHVVWEQWAVGPIESHVEVIVPPELSIVRLRSLRAGAPAGPGVVDLPRQVGLRGHITVEARPGARRAPPELLSVLLAHRDRRGWNTGFAIAVLTGVVLLLAALLVPSDVAEKHLGSAVTLILLGPGFTAGLLSLRAASDIADDLLSALRVLLALVWLCTVASAAALVGAPEIARELVTLLAAALLVLGLLLGFGAWRARRLFVESTQRERAEHLPRSPSRRLSAGSGRLRTPTPDRWLVSGEGEHVPWGWLAGPAGESTLDLESREEDRRYWSAAVGAPPQPDVVEGIIDFRRRVSA